jgi:transposase
MKYNIPEKIFQKIYDFLCTVNKIHTKDRERIRIFLEAVYYLVRSGCQIRLLPREYGNCFSIYQRFLGWEKRGIWKALFEACKDIDDEYFSIDSSIIRANQCAAGYNKGSHEDLGRSCGGFSTKIGVLVDALGNPVDFVLSPGNEHDINQAKELTKNLKNTQVY